MTLCKFGPGRVPLGPARPARPGEAPTLAILECECASLRCRLCRVAPQLQIARFSTAPKICLDSHASLAYFWAWWLRIFVSRANPKAGLDSLRDTRIDLVVGFRRCGERSSNFWGDFWGSFWNVIAVGRLFFGRSRWGRNSIARIVCSLRARNGKPSGEELSRATLRHHLNVFRIIAVR